MSTVATWESTVPAVATVSGNGAITAVGVGKTTILASANGITKKCTVNVKDNTPKTISLNEQKIEINKGESLTLVATVTGMSNKVTWSSSNKKLLP